MQNAPGPQQGRHRVATHQNQMSPQAGPDAGQPAGTRPQPGFAQPHPQQIPPQYGPAYQPQPGQAHAARPHPGQPYPAQTYRPQSFPAQHIPAQPGPAHPSAAQPSALQPQPMAQAPRNGLGIAALCLGIVGMLFGLIPFTGFIAFALGAIGIILGLVGFARARRRVATNAKTSLAGAILSMVAVALGIWGMVIVFTGLNQLSEDLSQIPSPSTSGVASGTALPADITNPTTAGPTTFQLEVTGDAGKMMVSYGTGSATSSTSDYQSLPWRKTVEATDDYPFAVVTATSSGPGSITCTITDTATGKVVSTQTSKSLDDSQYSSATVSCNSMG